MKIHSIPWIWQICAACSVVLVVSACSQLQQMAVDAKLERQYRNESSVLQKGHDAFFNKDYQAAWDIFDQLSQQATNADIVHAALYGMACSSFAKARTPAAMQDALDAWDAWYRVSPTPFNPLDPRMMAPMMQNNGMRQQLEAQIESLQDQLAAATDELTTLQNQLEKRATQMTSLKAQSTKQLSQHTTEVDRLNGQINHLVQENNKLRNQIEALQAIEQGIKAKKKEITAQ